MSTTVQFVLAFPQGHILFLQNGGAYFMPVDADAAFQIYGEHKELFGKKAITVSRSRDNTDAYSVVHEFGANGALTDARLVKGNETWRGTLADQQFVDVINASLAQGVMTLYSTHDTRPVTIYNVARFDDGRMLVQLSGKNELYIGTPGNFEKVDAFLYVQGGCSMYYKMPSGNTIELPWGMGGPNHENPKYAGQELMWDLRIKTGADPASIGLELAAGVKHLSPFSAEISGGGQGGARKPPSI